jgi:hypothetical protein
VDFALSIFSHLQKKMIDKFTDWRHLNNESKLIWLSSAESQIYIVLYIFFFTDRIFNLVQDSCGLEAASWFVALSPLSCSSDKLYIIHILLCVHVCDVYRHLFMLT